MSDSEVRYVISDEVECPICGAKPGEPCTEPDPSGPTGVRTVPPRRGHYGRVKATESDTDEPT